MHGPYAQVQSVAGKSRVRGLLLRAWDVAWRWRTRIFLAVADQGAASVSNFLLTILLAIWLPLDEFGRYVVIWSGSLLIESFQVALITDSMPAIVSRRGRQNRRRLDVAGLWVVLGYGAMTSLLILAAVPIAALWFPHFSVPLLCLALVNPLMRLYIYLRRLSYIRSRQDAATAASAIYGAIILSGVLTLLYFDFLSVSVVILLWGLACGAAALATALMGVAAFERTRAATAVWLTRELWRSGRWLAGAAIGFWITTWGLFPIIAAIAGTEAAGLVRALQNLFTPIVQFNAALNLAILPRVADAVVTAGTRYARRFAIYATVGFTSIVIVYAAIVVIEPQQLLTLIYRKPEIAAASALLWPLGLAMILESARQGSSMALLSLRRTQMFFVSRVVGVSVFILGVVVLGRMMGTEGILWANVTSHAVGTGLLMYEAFTIDRRFHSA